jgi:hypothetical protein
MISVYKRDGLTAPRLHSTSQFGVARGGIPCTRPSEKLRAMEWGYTESNGECQAAAPPLMFRRQ